MAPTAKAGRGRGRSTRLAILLVLLPAAALLFRLSRPRVTEARVTFPALGTFATIILETDSRVDPERIFRGADSLLRVLESETGRFYGQAVYSLNENRRAALADLNQDLQGVISLSASFHGSTLGLFDPTAGALVEAWGFPHDPVYPGAAAIDSLLEVTGWDRVIFRNDSIILPPGVRLDFGGVAKGYAADAVYRYAMSMGARSCLVEIGGDIRCGGDRLWRVAVRHPRNEGYHTVFLVDSGGLATSGDYESFFYHEGARHTHLINPFTGYPEPGIQSATVFASTCAEADAFATAGAIGGPDAALGFSSEGVFGIIMILEDTEGEETVWRTGVLPSTL